MNRQIQLRINQMPGLRRVLRRWKSFPLAIALVFPFLLPLAQQARGDDFAAMVGSVAIAFENRDTALVQVKKVMTTTRPDVLTFTFYNKNIPATDARIATATPDTLVNGEVLITGGVGNRGVTGSLDLYNPATATWLSTANLTAGLPANTVAPQFTTRALVWCKIIVAF